MAQGICRLRCLTTIPDVVVMAYPGGKVGTSGPMGDIEFSYSDNVDVAVINNGKGSPTVRCSLFKRLMPLQGPS